MQPQDLQTISRRPMDVEDYIDVVRRHKAWIFGPLFASLVISVVIAFLWPNTYLSVASIRVVPPQVSESMVPTNTNMDFQGRINSMTQQILSRGTLTSIINKHALYPKELKRLPMDDVVEEMRLRHIKIGAVQNLTAVGTGRDRAAAFQIGFEYSNRQLAKQVTEDLVAQFLGENQKETSENVTGTAKFMSDQKESAKKKLDDVEQKLSTFRSKNMGRLPEEQQSNYQALNALQTQMLNVNTSMSRVNQDKLLLENTLRTYKEQLSSLKDPNNQEVAQQKKNEKLAEKEREIAQLENYLTQLREHYKETHPDVQNLVIRLATAKKQKEALLKEEAEKKPDETATAARAPSPLFLREQRDLDLTIKRIQATIEAKDIEMEDYKKQATQIAATLKNYQARIEGIPVGIKEYDELMREKEMARREYEDLDKRLSTSEMSAKLVYRQAGERLEPLDPPSLPVEPTEPKRPIIIAAGTGLGLIIGLFLAGAREVKDGSLKNLKDVRAYTQLPVLGSIPLLENDLVVRRRRRLGWLAWSTACLLGVCTMAVSVAYYYNSKL